MVKRAKQRSDPFCVAVDLHSIIEQFWLFSLSSIASTNLFLDMISHLEVSANIRMKVAGIDNAIIYVVQIHFMRNYKPHLDLLELCSLYDSWENSLFSL